MRITRRGGPKLRLDLGEASVLLSLLAELKVMVASDDTADPVRQRLYPDAYEDPEQSAEFRRLTEGGLAAERTERIAECTAELASGTSVIDLGDGAGERWIKVLNDLRLALGTRIGVTEDWDHEVDPEDPAQFPQAAYLWLTGAQDALVQALMG